MEILDLDGGVAPTAEIGLSKTQIVSAYKDMLLARILDDKMIALQRQGRMGTYVSSAGQEACQIGSVLALKNEDWIFPMYRDLGIVIERKVPLASIMDKLFGNAEDPSLGRDLPNAFGWKEEKIFTLAAPIASHVPLAVGFAIGAKYRGDNLVTLATFGDGATSSGEFHVAMNFAGVFKAPTIFVCENNQYAISVPLNRQTASETIAIKAEAYGFEGIRVDGNDLFAVFRAVRDAAEKARNGAGPTLVECLTYRLGAHSTSDDWKKYRSSDEVEEWKRRDPLIRVRKFLERSGLWSADEESKQRKVFESMVNDGVSRAEHVPSPKLETMFTDVYSKMPWNLSEQFGEAE